jgi:hypothetical protein
MLCYLCYVIAYTMSRCDNWFIKGVRQLAGDPNTGIHSHRLFGFATVDVLLTVLLIIAIMYANNGHFALISVSLSVLFITVFSHWLFCVPTTLNKLLSIA